jgi:AraC family transcriptional regulator
LDVSKVAGSFQGLEIEIHRHPGVRVLRVVHPGPQSIAEHRHDWAYIGLHTLGRYRERYDGGEAEMTGPSAVLHPPGRPHADQVGNEGLETLTVEFDRGWLRARGFDRPLDQSRLWQGGCVGQAARRLAKLVSRPCSETAIAKATSAFLHIAYRSEDMPTPAWLGHVNHAIRHHASQSTRELARALDLNVDYLARAYRATAGEGLHETARRRRVERAAILLRRTDMPLVDVALDSGFCDQSHMNRCFRAVLGRTPVAVRAEAGSLSA